ncbi:MAG: hypothetical protein EAZ32_13200 [Cytophagia bacterium]|nr:MAG: hypothetical protein EAZ38_14310 [Cytophagales bacterium]TAG38192.1 MAG: hypothetical protein EAZ32_13200 [Cytophagia bacterium]
MLLKVLSVVVPKKIYLALDGPRNDEDLIKINIIKAMISEIKWESDIKYLLRDSNLGSHRAVPSSIDWFFSMEEEGIILEDDCLPDISFFQYCTELLNYYRHNEKIFSISGNNISPISYVSESYFFSHIPHIWGWATWKRAWNKFDFNLSDFPELKEKQILSHFFKSKHTQKTLLRFFEKAYQGGNIWDYKWTHSHIYYDGYSIIPSVNLVTNIGFDDRATNYLPKDSYLANLKLNSINDIVHNENIVYNEEYYSFLSENLYKDNLSLKFSKAVFYSKRWIKNKFSL